MATKDDRIGGDPGPARIRQIRPCATERNPRTVVVGGAGFPALHVLVVRLVTVARHNKNHFRFSPPALRFDLFKPRGGLETAFHNYRDARR